MRLLGLTLTVISLILCSESFGQTDREVAVLDMTAYNSETGTSRKLSSVRVMRTAGVPFTTVTSLTAAVQYPVIITGSRILQDAFNAGEISTLENYVSNGGILICSSVRDTNLYNLCGISDNTSSNSLYEINLDTNATTVIFDKINDSLEVKMSIGDSANMDPTFFTRWYDLTTAQSLGNYENGECAFAVNDFGSGKVYTWGPDFRDILWRNQTNFDYNAQRTYSNGFEPTGDVVMFIIRNIVRKHIPHTVYKYTIPHKYTSTLMLTHDVDSRTAMDTMQGFSSFEQTQNISALYNVTTRYLNDTWMTNFYVGTWSQVHQLVNDGHVLASHSVGHFPDFDDESLFPLGTTGNDPGNYTPIYSGGVTTGGSVMGELEVSKVLIVDDHSVPIRSFRAGHLAFNDSLMYAMEALGYEYNSTYSANNVLTSYPYYNPLLRSFSSQESNILEIPMTISDVFSADPINSGNYPQKVNIWIDATYRYDENHSPVVLLIHPNRNYKLTAQQDYLNQIPENMLIYPFEDYGDYWRKRDSLEFQTELNGNDLTVTIVDDKLTQEQSFVVDYTGLDTIMFENQLGNPIEFDWVEWDHGTRLYYQEEIGLGFHENITEKEFYVYPNPTNGNVTIYVPNNQQPYELMMFDLTGKMVFNQWVSGQQNSLDLAGYNLQNGTYIIVANLENETLRRKIVFVR